MQPKFGTKLIASLLVILCTPPILGTAQAPDRVLLAGKNHALHTNPLEQYYEKYPERHPREAADGENIGISSGLWRGYIATFEIIDSELRLKEFELENDSMDPEDWLRSEISRFFPTLESRRLLWYSGNLVLATGSLRHYIHLNYASEYGSYTLLQVQKGRVTKQADLTGEEFQRYKRKQFEVYRTTDSYRRLAAEIRREGNSELDVDRFIFEYGDFVEDVLLDFSEAKLDSRNR